VTPAVWGSPWNLRLVALDIETCVAPDNAHRIVSLGVAVCRDGGIRQRYEWLVQPGCPVDGVTAGIHGLTDRHLADEPTLDGILSELRRLLDPRPGETLVLAAHHAAFDLGWLRAEVERVGEPPLTDLPVLDTSGPLVRLAGLSLARPSLAQLLAALDLANERPHAALADATAAAEAAIVLLERADGLGHRDLDALLAEIGGATSATIRRAARRPARHQADAVVERPMPPGHVATHERDLGVAPTADELAAFRAGVIECAALRCEDLPARQAPDDLALGVLLGALDASASVLDVAGTATLLGALSPLLGRLPGKLAEMRRHIPDLVRVPRAGDRRGVALALDAWLAPRLDCL
jgi:DNA polymerase III epsilon subunit-like protein